MSERHERRIAALRRHARETTAEEARARLVRDGFITPEGDLAPEYGGPPREGEPDERPPSEMIRQALHRAETDTSPASLARAAGWLERAAALDEPEALIVLADWHRRGIHYPVDTARSGRLLAAAAGLGSAKARIRHFWLVERGADEVPDPRETYLAALREALAGDPEARLLVGRFCEMGFGTAKDSDAAQIWLSSTAGPRE